MLVMIGQEAGVRAHGVVAERVRAVIEAIGHRYARLTGWMRSAAPRHIVWRAAAALLMVPVVAGATLLQHVKYDRADLPDMEPLVRFEPPTIGHLYDARGELLLELAREYRWVVQYPEIPVTLREAVLAAEDKNFFSHGGVDFGALPRVAGKACPRGPWRRAAARRRRTGASGSRSSSRRADRRSPSSSCVGTSWAASPRTRTLACCSGRPWSRARWPRSWACPPRTSSAARCEEMRLSLWLEEDFRRRFGSHAGGQGADPGPLRVVHLPGQRPLRLLGRLRVLLRQAALRPTSSGTPTRRRCWPASRSRRATTRPRPRNLERPRGAATTCCG